MNSSRVEWVLMANNSQVVCKIFNGYQAFTMSRIVKIKSFISTNATIFSGLSYLFCEMCDENQA